MDAMLSSKTSSLCFNRDEFSSDDFSVDKFVSDCRKYASLETMHEDLNLYHKMLCAALIELINQDFADFVNLSSNLVGLDESIKNLAAPLEHMRKEIKDFSIDLDGTLETVQSIFSERTNTYKTKALIKHVFCVLQGLKKIDSINAKASKECKENCLPSDVLERIALDWNLVKFHMLKLNNSDISVLDHKKQDIEKLSKAFDRHLESMFIKSLSKNDRKSLIKVLRIYSVVNKEMDAENIFRETIVKPFTRSTLTEENISKYGLEKVYSYVLDFIDESCASILDVTRASNMFLSMIGDAGYKIVPGYDFLVNAVWPEIVESFERVAPVYVYAPGDAMLFHRNFLATKSFLRRFETCCQRETIVTHFRNHPSYTDFLKKWNLDLYFQIRFQEIASDFEDSLLQIVEVPMHASGSPFELKATNSLWHNINLCWSEKVYLKQLSSSFWRLTLQLLNRYSNWAHSALTSSEIEISHAKASLFIKDVEKLSIKLKAYFQEVICVHLFEITKEIDLLERAFSKAAASLKKIHILAGDYMVKSLTKQCFTHLKLISDIPRLYRKTNRQMPKNPSGYIALINRCLNDYLAETKEILSPTWREDILKNVVEAIVAQSLEIMHDVLTSIKKMEDSLKILKRARENKSAFENMSGTITDDDKMRRQLTIDVEYLHKSVQELGLKAENIKGFTELLSLVTSADKACS